MATKRVQVFLSENALQQGLEGNKMQLEGNKLCFAADEKWFGGLALHVETAVHIVREVTDLGDPEGLIGRVKTLAALEQMGGEYCEGSVLLGEVAYDVVQGFLAIDLQQADSSVPTSEGRPTETVPSMPAPPPVSVEAGDTKDAGTHKGHGLDDSMGQYAALAELFLEK